MPELVRVGVPQQVEAYKSNVLGYSVRPSTPFGKGEGSIQHHPAFEVQVVDTTGCGDVFHGAYATGIACGWDVSRCIRFASAAAAIKATKAGGRNGIPDRDTVCQFLKNV